MASNVPLTIQAGISPNYGSQIVIGSKSVTPPKFGSNMYWALILDRTNLAVKENFTFTSNNMVPPQVTPYIEGSKYIMILTTMGLSTQNLPQGAFYDFLIESGAGAALKRIEQIFEALNCGTWGQAGYTFVTVLDKDPSTSGFDFSDIYEYALVSTLQFIPFQIGPNVLYSPALLR